MASVSSLGVGSGLDLQGLLDKLMVVERQPITVLQNQAKSYQTKISALGTLSSKLSELQTAAKNLTPATLQTAAQKFATYTGEFADSSFGKVTVGDGAVAGSYALKVDKLAQQQKIRTGNLTDANVQTAAAAGTKITITAGTLSGLSGSSFAEDSNRSATIDLSGLSTLEEVRNAVNAQSKDTGVTASIVNDGAGKRLVFSGDKEGSDQAFQITSTSGFLAYNPVSGTPGFSTTQKARDAEFTLDGIAITSKRNKVTDVLDGVTLDLAKQGGETTLTVTREDTSKLKDSLQKFVDAYNSVAQSIGSLGSYDTETKAAGALNGNRILREAQLELRNLVFGTTGADGKTTLSSLGISFGGTDNTLKLDADKLAAAVAKDPEAVANFAAKVGKAFNDKVDTFVGTGGSIQVSTDSMKTTIRDLESRQEKLSLLLDQTQERYRKQFSALDSLLSSMNSTSSYLAQQLSSIASISS
ncbi:MAG: flagellar filament capping protein FliD, partial [Zoogloeaceae bacterium]|nr:flagellar filament capping protein FliD [Zoogloeaceae bacterium]